MASEKKLDDNGLGQVWEKVWELVKHLTGDVDIVGKGDLQTQIETVESIAKGRNQAHVFETTADMQAWLSNAENKGVYNKGDNIYIVDVNVPDWWIAEVLDTVDSSTGYYYKIAYLETQKVDLSEYLKNTGDTKNNVVAFTSADATSPTAWTDTDLLKSGEKHSSIFNKVSTMFKNVRFLYKMLGTTDISTLGGGTVTGAISELNNALQNYICQEKILDETDFWDFISNIPKRGIYKVMPDKLLFGGIPSNTKLDITVNTLIEIDASYDVKWGIKLKIFYGTTLLSSQFNYNQDIIYIFKIDLNGISQIVIEK